MIFDHVALFVRDIDEGKKELESILPIREWGKVFEDGILHVRVCFGKDASGLRYELVAPFGTPNPVSRFVKGGNNILNHLAYRVCDIEATAVKLCEAGAVPMGPAKPAMAFGGAQVMFFLTTLGFIIELIEGVDERVHQN